MHHYLQTEQAVTDRNILACPDLNAPSSFTVDASDMALGSLFSSTSFVTGCYVFDDELLAVYLAMHHFEHFVEG